MVKRILTALALVFIGAATPVTAGPAEAPFLAENNAAMAKMMTAMEIKPSGDVDKDFVAMMSPHHQGAIDMARSELLHGHNQQLIRIAQEIIVTQQQEIAAMRLAVGEPLPASVPFSRPAHVRRRTRDDSSLEHEHAHADADALGALDQTFRLFDHVVGRRSACARPAGLGGPGA